MIVRALILIACFAAPLLAQEPTAKARAEALQQNKLGVEHHEAGRREEAIAAFEKAAKLHPKHATYRRNLALALHSRAVDLIKKDRLEESLEDLERARELLPEEEVVNQGHAHALRRLGRLELARSALKKALGATPKAASLHEELGRVEYAADHLPEAIESIEKAMELDKGLTKRLQPFLEKLKREMRIEGRYLTEIRGLFTIKYDDEAFRQVSQEILELLDRHYNRLGREFGHWPKRRVTLVLYTRGDYDKATGAHGWTGGLFDGKIRLPVRNFSHASAAIESTLAHELCHLFIHDIARRCPLWLDEGLAQLRQGADPAHRRTLLRRALQAGELKSFTKLPGNWSRIGKARTVRLYYAQSLSFTAWLEGNYGRHALVRVLEGLAGGAKLDAVMKKVFARGLGELEGDWRESL